MDDFIGTMDQDFVLKACPDTLSHGLTNCRMIDGQTGCWKPIFSLWTAHIERNNALNRIAANTVALPQMLLLSYKPSRVPDSILPLLAPTLHRGCSDASASTAFTACPRSIEFDLRQPRKDLQLYPKFISNWGYLGLLLWQIWAATAFASHSHEEQS